MEWQERLEWSDRGNNNVSPQQTSQSSPWPGPATKTKCFDFTSALPAAEAPSLLLSRMMTLLKMQTSTTGRSLHWTGMSLWKCQSCRRDCVTITATRETQNYWGKKCHKKDSYWIFQVSSLMFPSVAWSRHPIRKASSRSYQSIHEHKKSSHTTHNGCPASSLLEV